MCWQHEDDGRMSQRQKKKEKGMKIQRKGSKDLSLMALSSWQMWDCSAAPKAESIYLEVQSGKQIQRMSVFIPV